MSYFTWKETGLTSDCASLEAMASRFEESAKLMRKMAQQGFRLKKRKNIQLISHPDPKIFKSWGFINEEPPVRQLTLISEAEIDKSNYTLESS
ncbi:hypothetical protein [Prochlorococcus sp. MIT 1307]|uniref:hypothetical protein n=1 Tax=Prochlorococcus sp. MIT 1307 TaxID=3096219 RepID=UPI002A75400A|nr:hypothetical protein [Prochlorococcus sp. MIT 1307]